MTSVCAGSDTVSLYMCDDGDDGDDEDVVLYSALTPCYLLYTLWRRQYAQEAILHLYICDDGDKG